MNKVLAILNSKYFLSTIIGLSILVIIIGVLMVKRANEQTAVYAEQQKQSADQQGSQEDDAMIQEFELIAKQAEATLKASRSPDSGLPAKMDFTTDENRKKVADMKNKTPVQGTEDWCEVMMIKPDADWTEAEQGIFAKNCL